jgi:cation diffusion facilitator CzcD-associated flavoprotein CzcO
MGAEHVDVLIVGAGLSGIGAAYHLQQECPQKSFLLLEARASLGGTWDLFRYPGVRSDSDMFTLGYRFRPWPDAKTIADGPAILDYVTATAREHEIDSKIRFHHAVRSARFSSKEGRWTVQVQRSDTGESVTLTCGFLCFCGGYYRYDEGYTPDFAGTEHFAGEIVHPQHWPQDLDYAGKRVVVIGSGATAVTLVPAMAQTAAHVTMLQRSPSYVVTLPAVDPIAKALRRILPSRWAYPLLRWKNVLITMLVFQLSRRRPEFVKRLIRRGVEQRLPPGFDIDTHFKPIYNPWDQRMCLVPDGDLFDAISSGGASVVTDRIDTFTEKGLKLASGAELEADVIVTATGLNMIALGGIELAVDDREIKLPETLSYKGMMLSGVPNFSFTIGYTNASWTLKCDLTNEYVCRLLRHMDERGYQICAPENGDPGLTTEPMVDFNSGYVLRAIDTFPRQGSRAPWRLYQNYALDTISLRFGSVQDGAMRFSTATAPDRDAQPLAA